ncbi:reverse transcriptase domain-containing protein [Tanacetum coccineum]
MLPKGRQLLKSPVITLDAIRQLINDGISSALKAQAAAMELLDNSIEKLNPRNSLFSRSKCAEEDRVTFATGTLTDDALSWWNAHAQPMGIEQANQITWTELKRLLTNKYCPRTEIKKMEDEFYGLTVNGSDLKTYIRRFQDISNLMSKLCRILEENFMKLFIPGDYRKALKETLLPQSLKLWRKPSTYPRGHWTKKLPGNKTTRTNLPTESILRDELAFVHFRISTLETTLEDIQLSSESSSI